MSIQENEFVDYLIIQNSWGDWGDNGKGDVSKIYLPFEAWAVLSNLPSNWPELIPNPNAKPKIVFQNDMWEGLNNDDVVALQDCLRYLGCMSPTQESTGYFGPVTLAAVKIFQGRYGILPQNGRVGPITRGKLNDIFT